MDDKIMGDLTDTARKLGEYIENGWVWHSSRLGREPLVMVKLDSSKMKLLRKMDNCAAQFLAVDCSTRTLRRANNWGIYLFRAAYASVKSKEVKWGYEERIRPLVGNMRVRRGQLQDIRMKLESELAVKMLDEVGEEGSYLLLDGASYFGKKKGFYVSLYEKCEKKGVILLAISKRSPTLRDEKGRDLTTTIYSFSRSPIWIYHPVLRADKKQHLYGDVSIVKLCGDSPRVFRCDIMEYLINREISELLSPLTSISEDPRCLGYPVVLWLAHDFSAPSNSKLLHYYDLTEKTLAEAGLLDVLRREELSCNFPDTLHGVRYPFEWEWIEYV